MTADAIKQAAELEEGLMLHFDIAFGRRLGVNAYACDPLMEALGVPDRLTVVSIHPSPAALQTQFEGRHHRQREQRGIARDLWRRAVHRPVRNLVRRIRGHTRLDTSRIYAHPRDLQRTYQEWIAFAQNLVSHAREGKLICVEPITGRDGRPSFAQVSDPPASSLSGRGGCARN